MVEPSGSRWVEELRTLSEILLQFPSKILTGRIAGGSIPFQGVLGWAASSYLGPKHTTENLLRVRSEQMFEWPHHTRKRKAAIAT